MASFESPSNTFASSTPRALAEFAELEQIIDSMRQLAAGSMPADILAGFFEPRLGYLREDAEVIVHQDAYPAPFIEEDAEMLWLSSTFLLGQLEELVREDAPAAIDGFMALVNEYAAGFAELVFVANGFVIDTGAVDPGGPGDPGDPPDETVVGGPDSESLDGGAGDDTITGGGGDDSIDGGAGQDTAMGTGPASEYLLQFEAGLLVLSDTAGGDGTDTLTNVERLQFADKTVIVETGAPAQSYAGLPDGLYQFFIVAFDAAPGVTYMDQLAEAWNYFEPQLGGDALREIVNIFTTKPQFTDVYPLSLGDDALAAELVNRIVKASASDEARAEAIADVEQALGIGWSRGDVIYQVFGNLGSKPFDDPTWGGTARQFDRQIEVAKVYTEVLLQGTTHLQTLRDVLQPVTPDTDVSSEAAIVSLIGQALLDGVGVPA